MSLINQVLQDLDRRHANAAGVPSAVKALPAAAGHARYARVVAIVAVAVVVVGGAAGAVAWSMGVRSAQVAAVSPPARVGAAAVAAPTPVVVAAPPSAVEPTPVVVAAAPAVAPASGAIALRETMAKPVADVTAPMRAATAAPATTALAPASLALTPRAIESPGNASLANANTLSTHVDARIEKRSPARTARERADAEYQRGVTAHQQDQLAEAASAYAAALREEASFVAARQALAGLMIGQGRADEARTLLTEGLALAPQHAGLAMMLARLQADRGELQRAAEILQATDSASMSAEDHAFRAAVLQRLNRHTEASDHFAAALRTTPTNGVWWMGLAISQAADGRNDTAKEAFNRARSSGSLSPELAQYVEQRLKQL